MIRVVLDTNVVVSALLQPLGLPAQVFVLAISGAIQLCITGQIYAEYEDVISRAKFQRDPATIAKALQTIRNAGPWVRPTERIRACPDPDDDIFLECAFAAGAGYLVTGNTKHFPTSWADTTVVTPRRILEFLSEQQ